LLSEGWEVEITGRRPENMPPDLAGRGAGFRISDRTDGSDLADAVGVGADLLVDCVCYSAADARLLVPLLEGVGATVMMSSKAVYVDADGNHANSDTRPRFPVPVAEDQPTMVPGDMDYDTREGYGANKVAAEQVLLASRHPITIIRPSKVHGPWSKRPREWVFVKRVLDGRRPLILVDRGRGIDHPTAAANIASLVMAVAAHPGQRVLNCADPDAPSGLAIARTVAAHMTHHWEEALLSDGSPPGFPGLGAHPWDAPHPIVLDMRAAEAIGYRAVGDYAATVAEAIDWMVEAHRGGPGAAVFTGSTFFERFFDYDSEDRYLAEISRQSQRPLPAM
jgi:nucleoside-diphosphate-sugar epimerase